MIIGCSTLEEGGSFFRTLQKLSTPTFTWGFLSAPGGTASCCAAHLLIQDDQPPLLHHDSNCKYFTTTLADMSWRSTSQSCPVFFVDGKRCPSVRIFQHFTRGRWFRAARWWIAISFSHLERCDINSND